MKPRYYKYQAFARILEIGIGLYFFAGAVVKVFEIDTFAVQMASYRIIETPRFLEPAVLFTVFVEAAIGMALVLGLRFKGLTVVLLQAIIVVFSGLIIYAWQVHGIDDCGCFPIIQMSPPVSLFKNTLILLAGGYIIWQLVYKPTATASKSAPMQEDQRGGGVSERSMTRKLVKTGISCMLALLCVGGAWHGLDRVALGHDEQGSEQGIFAQFEIFDEQGYFNLSEGLHLVPVMATSCPECKEKVPELNDLYLYPEIPPMIALCYEDVEGDLGVFRALTSPLFPTYSIGNRTLLYFRLIDKEPFRLVLVLNGTMVTAWEGYVPEYEELMRAVNEIEQAL